MRVDLHKFPFISKRAIPWIIWSIAGLFYFFEIILRMLPGTMTDELMRIFKINATELGVFTAFYYWSYTIMQIPAGLIVDRYSIRKTLLTATSLCIVGFILIHISHVLSYAELGRFIVGFGSAFAYVSALKVASIWLPKNHFGLATCIVDSLGMIGAMFAEIVLVRINLSSGYRSSITLMLITGVIVAMLILLVLRDSPDEQKYKQKNKSIASNSNILDKLQLILKNPQIWLIGTIGLLFYLPSSVLGDVYGLPYLKTVYHISRAEASMLMATFFAGWTIVGPFLGALSDKIQKRCLPIKLTLILDTILFSLIIFVPVLTSHLIPIDLLFVMFFFIGVATGTHPLVFAIAKENFSIHIAGTVVAVTNTFIMLGGLVFQPLVGKLLDISHHSVGRAGIEHYTTANYTFALAIIPISLLICIGLMHFVKDTGYKLSEQDNEQELLSSSVVNQNPSAIPGGGNVETVA